VGWREWLGLSEADRSDVDTRTEVVARIARALDALGPDRARFVAAFAYHLGRIAHADHELTTAERDVIRALIVEESGLPDEQAALVVDLVAHESLVFRGTEDYRVLREFDEMASPAQKVALIRCMFAVSAADAHVVTREDNEIRQVALALKVSHEDFVAARAAVRAHLAVLKEKRRHPVDGDDPARA
jgi:uncharacterized tellurite resistance protein B-like protein